MKDITKFLECKRIALVGVSRKPHHFSRALLREFAGAGYDPVPVNREAAEVEGRKCFTCLSEITPAVEAALLLTATAGATDQAVRECQQADIRRIWIYKNVHDGRNHEQTIEFCRVQKFAIIEGYCPLMFLPRAGFVHRAHGFFLKLAGHYPL